MVSLNDRIEGCLIGAAIGLELGWFRHKNRELFRTTNVQDLLAIKLDRVQDPPPAGPPPAVGMSVIWSTRLTALVGLGLRAYVNRRGRVMPEDFGRELAEDPAIAGGSFLYGTLHTTQELLKEGMQPRLTGMGAAPTALLVPAMIGVGIYHFPTPTMHTSMASNWRRWPSPAPPRTGPPCPRSRPPRLCGRARRRRM